MFIICILIICEYLWIFVSQSIVAPLFVIFVVLCWIFVVAIIKTNDFFFGFSGSNSIFIFSLSNCNGSGDDIPFFHTHWHLNTHKNIQQSMSWKQKTYPITFCGVIWNPFVFLTKCHFLLKIILKHPYVQYLYNVSLTVSIKLHVCYIQLFLAQVQVHIIPQVQKCCIFAILSQIDTVVFNKCIIYMFVSNGYPGLL